jgi:hypothetical protein
MCDVIPISRCDGGQSDVVIGVKTPRGGRGGGVLDPVVRGGNTRFRKLLSHQTPKRICHGGPQCNVGVYTISDVAIYVFFPCLFQKASKPAPGPSLVTPPIAVHCAPQTYGKHGHVRRESATHINGMCRIGKIIQEKRGASDQMVSEQ